MERNDILLWFGGLILTWVLGMIQGYAIGRQPVSKKTAAKILAAASKKARQEKQFIAPVLERFGRKPMNIGGIEK